MEEMQVAREAAYQAGEIVQRYFEQGVAIRSKESHNLVSDADVEAEQAIARVIQSVYPDHAILGEEVYQEPNSSEHLWVVDPIDGTNNFAHQIPHFGISIAYYRRGEAQCGVVLNPIRRDEYTATRGQGAFHNGEAVGVADDASLDVTLAGVGFYYDRGRLMEATLACMGDLFREQVHGLRRMGAASLDLCMVGLGNLGVFFEFELSPWDFAAGQLFVTEAGGCVTTCHGNPMRLTKSSVLATNTKLHAAVLPIVSRHCPDEVNEWTK